jgi:hypothetical protein
LVIVASLRSASPQQNIVYDHIHYSFLRGEAAPSLARHSHRIAQPFIKIISVSYGGLATLGGGFAAIK